MFSCAGKSRLLWLILLGVLWCTGALGAPHGPITTSLFGSDDVLELTLETDLKALLRDRGDDREYHSATITYPAADGSVATHDLKVKVRGNFRRNRRNCDFPPLMLNLKKKQVDGTLFDGQNKLKLVTPCKARSDQYEDYILQEYLIYKAYNLLTDQSFRVQLVRVTYTDVNDKRKPLTRFAFLIEDEDQMAERNGGEILKLSGLPQHALSANHAMLTSVFQYMIGNTDWSARNGHNLKLMQTGPQQVFAVPYDFDFSGVIATRYATPAPGLGLRSVEERLYRGVCRSADELAPVFARFNDRKDALYALYTSFPHLSEKAKRRTLDYFDDFYETINNPYGIEASFVKSCRDLMQG